MLGQGPQKRGDDSDVQVFHLVLFQVLEQKIKGNDRKKIGQIVVTDKCGQKGIHGDICENNDPQKVDPFVF